MSKDVSLIEAIQKLTSAVEANTAAVLGGKASAPTPAIPVQPEAADEAQAEELGEPLDYACTVKPVLLKLIGKDREKAAKVLAAFGAKKGDQVPAESLAAFFTAIQLALVDG